jgi:hypothetical protein
MPDIILLASNWQPRALVRAQLIEEGFDVVAMDDWSAAAALLKDRRPPDPSTSRDFRTQTMC